MPTSAPRLATLALAAPLLFVALGATGCKDYTQGEAVACLISGSERLQPDAQRDALDVTGVVIDDLKNADFDPGGESCAIRAARILTVDPEDGGDVIEVGYGLLDLDLSDITPGAAALPGSTVDLVFAELDGGSAFSVQSGGALYSAVVASEGADPLRGVERGGVTATFGPYVGSRYEDCGRLRIRRLDITSATDSVTLKPGRSDALDVGGVAFSAYNLRSWSWTGGAETRCADLAYPQHYALWTR